MLIFLLFVVHRENVSLLVTFVGIIALIRNHQKFVSLRKNNNFFAGFEKFLLPNLGLIFFSLICD